MIESEELTAVDACAAVDLLRPGEISPSLLDAVEERIVLVDRYVNAPPTGCLIARAPCGSTVAAAN